MTATNNPYSKPNANTPLPLTGLRVLDLGNFMAGPMAATWLGDFGAEVIKVEHPNGDGVRHWGQTKDGDPLYWKMLSRNKRCITLNLSRSDGQEILRRLVAQSDVLVENFTPGTMARWNLGYDRLSEVNPRLVMLSISAYGQTGPYSQRPGFGTLAEAMSGYAYINGQEDGPPTLPSFGLADGVAGLNGAFGVLAALRYRDQTGIGQHVDAALYEPLLTILGPQVIEFDQLGLVQERLGSRLPFSAPRNVYRTKDDRWLSMSSSAQSVFERTMKAIGKEELIKDPRFLDNRLRGVNHLAIDREIGDWCSRRTLDEAMTVLVAAEAAAAPVYSVADVVTDPHFVARGSIVSVVDEKLGPLKMQAPFPHLSKTPGKISSVGEALGESNEAVYRDLLGMAGGEIVRLRSEGTI